MIKEELKYLGSSLLYCTSYTKKRQEKGHHFYVFKIEDSSHWMQF